MSRSRDADIAVATRALVAALALALVTARCAPRSRVSPSPSPSPSVSATPTSPPVTIRAGSRPGQRVTITVTSRGRRLYFITADSNVVDPAPSGGYRAHFVRPSIVFYDRNGKTMAGNARRADVDGMTKVVTMRGDVRVRTAEGALLTCDTMTYNDVTDRIHGTGHVRLQTRTGDVLTGDRLDGDVRLDRVRVTQGEERP
jgi:LPS export ABC transporter protein LptC